MHPWTILQSLVILSLANGAPVIAKRILGRRFEQPVDCGMKLWDGRALFGPSKTIRGVLLSILVSAAGAPLVGVPVQMGVVMGAAAMAGDLCSSFVKRRLGFKPSSRATGLDQVPESLLPLLVARQALALTAADIAVTVLVFFVGEFLLSRLLYKWHIRDEPY